MTSWQAMQARRRVARRLSREVGELARAATGASEARMLARTVLTDLDGVPDPTSQVVAGAVAARCSGDVQRSALAAYLHLCRALSLDDVAATFGVDPAAARRLVERGTGTAPVTAGVECRGWALVLPRTGRTSAEQHAAAGHLALCRRCRNKLRAHASLEQRVAVAGSTTFGASVTTAVGRALTGGHAATSAAGALTGPIVALSTAAALTTGVAGFTLATHGHHRPTAPSLVRPHGQLHRLDATPAADSGAAPDATTTRGTGPTVRTTTVPRPSRSGQLQPPGAGLLPLPTVSAPALPVPLPTVSVSPLPVPVPTATLPVPLPTLSLPSLP